MIIGIVIIVMLIIAVTLYFDGFMHRKEEEWRKEFMLLASCYGLPNADQEADYLIARGEWKTIKPHIAAKLASDMWLSR
jgi:hypothetical protein